MLSFRVCLSAFVLQTKSPVLRGPPLGTLLPVLDWPPADSSLENPLSLCCPHLTPPRAVSTGSVSGHLLPVSRIKK